MNYNLTEILTSVNIPGNFRIFIDLLSCLLVDRLSAGNPVFAMLQENTAFNS